MHKAILLTLVASKNWTHWRSQSSLPTPIRSPSPATAIIHWKNSGECQISWPVSTQARQLPTAIQVILYGRLFSTPQPSQATQQLLSSRDISANLSSYLMAGAVGGMFTGVTFNNSPGNASINFQSNAKTKERLSAMKEKQLKW